MESLKKLLKFRIILVIIYVVFLLYLIYLPADAWFDPIVISLLPWLTLLGESTFTKLAEFLGSATLILLPIFNLLNIAILYYLGLLLDKLFKIK